MTKKIDGINKEIIFLNKKLKKLDKKTDYLDTKIDMKFDILDKRMGKLEIRMDKLDKKIDDVRDGLIMYIDNRLEPFEEMRKDFYSFKDQVLKTLDWLVGAFKKFDEEHTVLTSRYIYCQEKLENHDNRLYVMEKHIKYDIRGE